MSDISDIWRHYSHCFDHAHITQYDTAYMLLIILISRYIPIRSVITSIVSMYLHPIYCYITYSASLAQHLLCSLAHKCAGVSKGLHVQKYARNW